MHNDFVLLKSLDKDSISLLKSLSHFLLVLSSLYAFSFAWGQDSEDINSSFPLSPFEKAELRRLLDMDFLEPDHIETMYPGVDVEPTRVERTFILSILKKF